MARNAFVGLMSFSCTMCLRSELPHASKWSKSQDRRLWLVGSLNGAIVLAAVRCSHRPLSSLPSIHLTDKSGTTKASWYRQRMPINHAYNVYRFQHGKDDQCRIYHYGLFYKGHHHIQIQHSQYTLPNDKTEERNGKETLACFACWSQCIVVPETWPQQWLMSSVYQVRPFCLENHPVPFLPHQRTTAYV